MPKEPRPNLGRYKVENKQKVNGTVNNFRKWRKKKLTQKKASRKINRA